MSRPEPDALPDFIRRGRAAQDAVNALGAGRPEPVVPVDPAVAAVEVYPTEAEWLAARRTGIGASEVAAVLGLSRFASPASVWLDKCGLAEPEGEVERLRWGKRLQRPIAEGFAAETGRELLDPGPYTLLRSIRYPWLVASPDYFQAHAGLRTVPGVLEIKNASAYAKREWQDEAPVPYQLQLHAQCLVSGLAWGTLAALLGGAELVFVDLDARPDIAQWILDDTAAFWRYVQTETPPPQLDGSEQTTRALRRLYPTGAAGPVVTLPDAAENWDAEILDGEATIAEIEERVNAAKNHIRAAIGDFESGRIPSGHVWTHKLETRKGYTKTVEPWTGRVLRRRGARPEGGQ